MFRTIALLFLFACSPATSKGVTTVHNTLCPELVAIEAITLAVLQEQGVSEQRINETHAGFLALQAACVATTASTTPEVTPEAI
jgi:hypothetical protein